jgi:hypothetical protein
MTSLLLFQALPTFDGSDASFFFSASIHAPIRFRMPVSVHSLRSLSSRSISALICAISPGESMAASVR